MFHILANGTEIYDPHDDKMRLLSPRLIMEIGKAGSLEFSVPVTNRYYGRLQQLSTNITVELDDDEIFRGRVLSNTRGFDNTRKIYVEGDLAYLVDSVQKGEKFVGKTHELFRKIVSAHNSRVDPDKRFAVGAIGIENRDIAIYGQSDEDIEDAETGEIDYRQIVINSTVDDWLSTYDYIESTLIDYCGGYLRTRRVGNIIYLDLLTDYTEDINLFDRSLCRASAKNNGLTFSWTGSQFTLKGTATGAAINAYLLGSYTSTTPSFVLPAGTYTFLCTGSHTCTFYYRYADSISTRRVANATLNGNVYTFTEDALITGLKPANAVTGTTYDLTFDILIIQGDRNAEQSKVTQEIEFGRNILDLTEEISAEDLFTVLIPLGDENLTIESVNGGSDELVDENAVMRFGRIVRTHTFPSVNQPSTLLENGQRYLASNANIPVSISVKAVDLHFVNSVVAPINVGDKVRINSLPHDIYEYLTCTRIEYDLSNPSNNVYTFGNPKQTLTERYRKDRKKDSGGGGGGAAAAEAEKRADDGLQDFFNAWINVDPESAHIDLGTLYKDYESGKLVLRRDCGIDISGATGNINIRSLKTDYDELGKEVASQGSQINILTEDTKSAIELTAAYYRGEDRHYAEFKTYATDTTSAIEAQAEQIKLCAKQTDLNTLDDNLHNVRQILTKECGIYLDGTANNVNIRSFYEEANRTLGNHTTSIASIKTQANAIAGSVEINAQHISQLDTDKVSQATLKLTADSLGSRIDAKADKITLDANVVEIKKRLSAAEANIKTIKANYLTADNIGTQTLRCSKLIATGDITALNVSANTAVNAGSYMKIANVLVATQKLVKDTYLSKKDAADTYATYGWVNGRGFATQVWVDNQGFAYNSTLTSYATRVWVQNNFAPINS